MSRLRRLFRGPAPVIRDDRLARDERFLQWLAFGFVFDHDVARAQVERLGAAMNAWQVADGGAWATADVADQDGYLSGLLTDVVRDALAQVPPGRPLVLSLSGGHDSRAVAAVWPAGTPAAVTYGRPGADDFDTVRVLAAGRYVDVRWYDVRQLEWRRERLVPELMGQRDRHASPRSVVQPLLDDELGPHALVHGFANGPLTGSRAWPEGTWAQELRAFAGMHDRFGFQVALGEETVYSLLPDQPWPGPVPFAAQLSSVEQHQRIRPVSTPVRHLVLPFDDDRWQGFWLSRSPVELADRRRWMEFLARDWPEWFPELADWDGREPVREAQRRWLRRCAPPRDPTDPGPERPAADHCWRSDYRDNDSFRMLVDDSLARLRARRVLEERFLDGRLRQWRRGTRDGWRAVRGLVSTELGLAGGAFD